MDLVTYIQNDLADGLAQIYSDRFSQRIWTSASRPNKYSQIDLAKGFEKYVKSVFA